MGDKCIVLQFHIEFRANSAGCGSISIDAGPQNAVIQTDNAFDPYQDLIRWISEIIGSQEENKIEIDEEGHIKCIMVRQKQGASEIELIVKDWDFPGDPEDKVYIYAHISREVFIWRFLIKFQHFIRTKFDAKDWYRCGEKINLLAELDKVMVNYKRTPTIVVMADFGNGPYAWIRYADDPPRSCAGGNIADAVSGFPEEYGVSKELDKEFADWIIDFENHYDESDFNWEKWNAVGLSLTKSLNRELGRKIPVEYHVPMEDPSNPNGDKIIKIDRDKDSGAVESGYDGP